MGQYKQRIATKGDRHFLESLQIEAFGSIIMTSLFRLYSRIIYGNVQTYIVEHQGIPVGYYQTWGRFKSLHLSFIAVSKDYQGKGVGSYILTKINDYAYNNGKVKTTYHTRVSNTAMQQLGAKYGYYRKKVIRFYYTDEDAYLYQKDFKE